MRVAMRKQRLTGFTLMEMLTVIAIVGVVLVVIVGIIMQTGRIYARTAVHPSPQSDLDLAMKRLAPDFRTALAVTVNAGNNIVSNGTRIELIMPAKDPNTGFNLVQKDTNNANLLILKPGETVEYFLGTISYPDPNDTSSWLATPDENGGYLFRTDGDVQKSGGSYVNAPFLISGLIPPADGADPIFLYGPDDNSSEPALATRLVRVTLTKNRPAEVTPQGKENPAQQSIWTQFCIRNMVTSGQGP